MALCSWSCLHGADQQHLPCGSGKHQQWSTADSPWLVLCDLNSLRDCLRTHFHATLIYNHCTTHWSHLYTHTHPAHTHGPVRIIHLGVVCCCACDFSSGLMMTNKPCLYLNLFVCWSVLVYVCIHACVCVSVSGRGVYAPRGWWLWEVGPGYRFTSCRLHRAERGQLSLPSCGQGRLQQDPQGRQMTFTLWWDTSVVTAAPNYHRRTKLLHVQLSAMCTHEFIATSTFCKLTVRCSLENSIWSSIIGLPDASHCTKGPWCCLTDAVSLFWYSSCITFKMVLTDIVHVVSLGRGSQHSEVERAWTGGAGVRKESSGLRPGEHQVRVLAWRLSRTYWERRCTIEWICVSHLTFHRYTVISGTPEKILEHFLEAMRMDIHHGEPGSQIEN